MRAHALLIAVAVLGSAASAHAGTAHITGGGLDFYMESADMPGHVTSPGSHWLSGPELRSLHQELNAAGIGTDGVVTFLLANTGAGLTMFALVDNNDVPGAGTVDSILGMTSTTVASAGYVMNDLGVDINGYSTDGTTQTLFGDYFWHPDGGADGMAWTGLQLGDTGTFDFAAYDGEQGGETAGTASTFPGLAGSETFQFITWTGTTWESIMSSSFDEGGSFGFAFAIVPLPPAVALGLAGIGIVAFARRRRAKKA